MLTKSKNMLSTLERLYIINYNFTSTVGDAIVYSYYCYEFVLKTYIFNII